VIVDEAVVPMVISDPVGSGQKFAAIAKLVAEAVAIAQWPLARMSGWGWGHCRP